MNAFKKTTIGIVLALLAASSVYALEGEFKNSLNKIELTKDADNSYSVNLYTKEQFSQTPKVIKKSDLNYYILLPETKNDVTTTVLNNNEIRSISTNLYPYAGEDINNGYTKININTTKPINFSVNIKNITQASAPIPAETIAQGTNKEIKNEGETQKTQKKNSEFSKENKPLEKKLQKKSVIAANKSESKSQSIEKENIKPKIQEKNIEDMVREEVEKSKTDFENYADKNEFDSPDVIDNEVIEQYIYGLENPSDLENPQNLTPVKKTGVFYSLKAKLKLFKNKFINKLKEYGIAPNDLLFMGLAAIFSFFIMLFILNSRNNNQTRLKSKNDLIETLDKNNTLTPKKPECDKVKQKNDGQYFVFDKNIKQTGFCDPATSAIKRNYELTSYEPDLRENYGVARSSSSIQSAQREESEYDIIQKILKEDTFIEIAPDEFKTVSKAHPLQNKQETKTITSPIDEDKKDIKEEVRKTIEPLVLSSVEITPERGFMCVSYNDNISLVGYIFDDVFALYNFKQPKLENYDIKYRLSEKKDKSTNFIVKVNNTKMLISVTKSSMNLEVALN